MNQFYRCYQCQENNRGEVKKKESTTRQCRSISSSYPTLTEANQKSLPFKTTKDKLFVSPSNKEKLYRHKSHTRESLSVVFSESAKFWHKFRGHGTPCGNFHCWQEDENRRQVKFSFSVSLGLEVPQRGFVYSDRNWKGIPPPHSCRVADFLTINVIIGLKKYWKTISTTWINM